MSGDAFDLIFVHFCRHPSFRDALRDSDPQFYARLDALTRPRLTPRI